MNELAGRDRPDVAQRRSEDLRAGGGPDEVGDEPGPAGLGLAADGRVGLPVPGVGRLALGLTARRSLGFEPINRKIAGDDDPGFGRSGFPG